MLNADSDISEHCQTARAHFRQQFQTEPRICLSPGRINLIGEHTDYNDGFVLPMAIDRYVVAAFATNRLGTLRARSLDYDDFHELRLDSLRPPERGGSHWYDYIGGVGWAMGQAGFVLHGVDLVLIGNVPRGAGLSSSAALELAVARALVAAVSREWDALHVAKIAQRAENEYVGVSCGIMDQLTVAASREGCAILIDCRSLDYAAVPIPGEAAVVVMDTATRRALSSQAYNERRRSCEGAVRKLREHDPSLLALRDVTPETLEGARDSLDPEIYRRVRHVVGENARTLEMEDAMRNGELELAGRLMNDSHRSLRDLYEVSSPELDSMTELARKHPACFGARMTGAGFGGCGVALVAAERSQEFAAQVEAAYRAETSLPGSLHVCRAVDGTRLI